MEQNVLIQEVRSLFNQACARNGAGDIAGANGSLGDILKLLTKELVVESSAEPDSPDQAGRT